MEAPDLREPRAVSASTHKTLGSTDRAASDHQLLCFTQNKAKQFHQKCLLFRLQSCCLGTGNRAICLLFSQQNILQSVTVKNKHGTSFCQNGEFNTIQIFIMD